MTQLLSPPRPDVNAAEKGKLKTYFDVIYALMMHDIKNRFFGNGLGMIVMVLWPFVHITVLIAIYLFTHRPHPFGEGIVQYSAVSLFPYIVFNYVGRWISLSAQQNKPFLNYPIIKPIDIIVARTLLELVSITVFAIMLVLFVEMSGSTIMPDAPDQAAEAAFAIAFLAISFGFLNAPFTFIIPLWPLVTTLFILLMWVASGVLFVTSQLPEQARVPLSYNPLLHCVEWMRIAYYSDYPTDILDRMYIFEFSLSMLTIGLILMRLFRRYF